MKRFNLSLLILLLTFCSAEISFAQPLQANIWYFGNHAGLDFNSGSPVAISGSQLYSLEGCAAISDRNTGQLLFYTQGDTVWNKNHICMPNGTGLWGHKSSTQAAVAVPNPADGNQYYLFTAAAQANIGFPSQPWGGIAYSVIDMTLNGGLGDVDTTQKNIGLVSPATEKLAAIQHCNGTDYWVVAHKWNTNEFYAYQISASGISAPVISAVGLVHQDVGSGQASETIGYMKFSPDGKSLSLACFSEMNKAELFDFNNVTGVVSNPLTLSLPPSLPPDFYPGPYGLSFSPSGDLLYVVWHDYNGQPNYIFQYNLTLGSDTAINASRTIVASTTSWNIGALQLATNGKLYIANFTYNSGNPVFGSPTIGYFSSPNSAGLSCGWVANGVSLDTNTSIWGLPNFIESNLSSEALSLGPDFYLVPPFSVTLDADSGFASYLWSDGSTGQTITATANGTYWVSVINQNGCTQVDTIHILYPLSVNFEATFTGFNVSYSKENSVQMSFVSHITQDLSASIYSMEGKLLFRESYKSVSGLFNHEYTLNYSRGIYLFSLSGNHETKNVKLIVR